MPPSRTDMYEVMNKGNLYSLPFYASVTGWGVGVPFYPGLWPSDSSTPTIQATIISELLDEPRINGISIATWKRVMPILDRTNVRIHDFKDHLFHDFSDPFTNLDFSLAFAAIQTAMNMFHVKPLLFHNWEQSIQNLQEDAPGDSNTTKVAKDLLRSRCVREYEILATGFLFNTDYFNRGNLGWQAVPWNGLRLDSIVGQFYPLFFKVFRASGVERGERYDGEVVASALRHFNIYQTVDHPDNVQISNLFSPEDQDDMSNEAFSFLANFCEFIDMAHQTMDVGHGRRLPDAAPPDLTMSTDVWTPFDESTHDYAAAKLGYEFAQALEGSVLTPAPAPAPAP